MLFKYEVETDKRESFINIDSLVQKALAESKLKSGVVVVFTPHTTAGVTINENADPDVVRDLVYGMNVTFDNKKEYRHAEGNSDSHERRFHMGVRIALGMPVLFFVVERDIHAVDQIPHDLRICIFIYCTTRSRQALEDNLPPAFPLS